MWVNQRKRKRRNNSESVQPARLKIREGRTPLLNAINFPGKESCHGN